MSNDTFPCRFCGGEHPILTAACPATLRADSRQASLFDADASAARRDEAIDRADKNASEPWKDEALGVIRHLAQTRLSFTSDDVWSVLALRGVACTHEPRALGALFRRAQGEGLIEPSDRWRQSTKTSNHCRPVRVWLSC